MIVQNLRSPTHRRPPPRRQQRQSQPPSSSQYGLLHTKSNELLHCVDRFGIESKAQKQASDVVWSSKYDCILESCPNLWSLEEFSRTIAPLRCDLVFLGRLGSGGNAVIDEVNIRGRSSTMARKTLQRSFGIAQRIVSREVESMSKLQHPHIVRLVTAYRDAGSVALLMEPVADYNLSQYLARCTTSRTDQRNLWLWFGCLISGLQYIHAQGVRHYDIKPSNILVKNQDVLFTDFGSSDVKAARKSDDMKNLGLTKLYAAPEASRGKPREASDIFSLGCVFLEMATMLVSPSLRTQLNRHQQSTLRDAQTTLHWAITWTDTLYGLASERHSSTEVLSLLDTCQCMTNLIPENRPNATKIQEQMRLHGYSPCFHFLHMSISEVVIQGLKKSCTWPLDKASSRQGRNIRRRLQLISATRNHQDHRSMNTKRTDLRAQQRSDTQVSSVNMQQWERARAGAVSKNRAAESRGVRLDSMMMRFMFQTDYHELFHVLGEATPTTQATWKKTWERLLHNPGQYELEEMTLELSQLSVRHDYECDGS